MAPGSELSLRGKARQKTISLTLIFIAFQISCISISYGLPASEIILRPDQPNLLPKPDVIGTSRPIIGVVAQTTYGKRARHGPTYFAASYVKYLESAGARVVPIKINQTEEYYNVSMMGFV